MGYTTHGVDGRGTPGNRPSTIFEMSMIFHQLSTKLKSYAAWYGTLGKANFLAIACAKLIGVPSVAKVCPPRSSERR